MIVIFISIFFQEFIDYEKHSLMHVYHCDECNKPFAGIGGLRIHKRQHMTFYLQNKAKRKRLVKGMNFVILLMIKLYIYPIILLNSFNI